MTADQIYCDVLFALQKAEELGGPEPKDYIALMERVATECATRADNARELSRTSRKSYRMFEYFHEWDTGGGCLALGRQLDGGGYVLITVAFDSALPEIGESFDVGIYNSDGDGVVLEEFPASATDEEVERFIQDNAAKVAG